MVPSDPPVTPWRLAFDTYRRWRASRARREVAADPVGTALRDLGRGDFEALVAEIFRRRGYRVGTPLADQDRGLAALPLHDAEGQALAHIRHWRAWTADAAEVQALIAAMATAGVGRGYLVIPGEFTRAARRMAEGRPLVLIDGARLSALVGTGSALPAEPAPSPTRKPKRKMRVRWRWLLHLAGALLAALAILHGFRWIESLPDKRLQPQSPPTPPAMPAPADPVILVPEPPAPPAAPEPPPPPPGLGGFRSVAELDAAFDAFYLPPPGCASPSSRDDLVSCANDRIRARRSFMAAREPGGSEPDDGPPAPTEAMPGDDGLVWDNSEAAIDALAPAVDDRDRQGYPPPYDTQSGPPEPDVAEPGEQPSEPAPIPVPSEPRRDPEATYAPYDPKAPWVNP